MENQIYSDVISSLKIGGEEDLWKEESQLAATAKITMDVTLAQR